MNSLEDAVRVARRFIDWTAIDVVFWRSPGGWRAKAVRGPCDESLAIARRQDPKAVLVNGVALGLNVDAKGRPASARDIAEHVLAMREGVLA